MRPGVPWSVKGIEPEAREAAKQAARRAGMTLGAWLNHVIMDKGTDEDAAFGAPPGDMAGFEAAGSQPQSPRQQGFMQPSAYAPPPMQAQIDLSPVTEAVRDLVRRIDSNERRIESSLEALAERVETSEQAIATTGGQSADAMLERKVQQLTDRLEAAERQRTPFGRRPEDRMAFQGLEKTMNAVVDHLETVDTQSEQKFSEIRTILSELSERVESSETTSKLTQEQAKTDALGRTLQNLSERMAEMEQAVHSATTSAEQNRRAAVEEAVKTVSSKLDSDQQRTRIADLQQMIDKLSARIERSEAQSANAIKALEGSLTGFIERLEHSQVTAADVVPQVMQQLDGRLEEVVSRVTDSETRALETASSVEQALSSLAQTVTTTEQRNAEARETVQSMVAQVNQRIEKLETGSKAPLSPTVAVGAGLAGMAPPPLSSAPPPPSSARAPADKPAASLRAPEPSAPPPPPSSEPSPPPLDAVGPPPPPPQEPPLAAPSEPPMGEPPVLNEKKAARDFIAAARRAAQSAYATGEPGNLGFGEQGARYAAFEEQEESRGKRLAILIGGAIAALVVVLALVNWLVAPSTQEEPPQDIDAILNEEAGGDVSGIDTLTDSEPAAAPGEATVPESNASAAAAQVIPEAIPEDAGTADAAEVPASTSSAGAVASRPAPAPLPEPRAPATAAPRSIVPDATDMPPVEAAPTTPVTRAPVTQRNALRAAAADGNPAAQYEVGLRYARGGGVPQDYDQAAYWFELAAKQNLAIAQYRLATLFEKGRGVSQDLEQARAWYEKAAQAGNVKAMHNLAVIYAEGKGVPQDFGKAAQWFLAAADHGLADSQYNGAVLLERGLGVEADPAEAYKWFTIAANNGDEGAAARRDAIAERLDATSLVDAKLAAQTWSPKAADPVANGNLSSLGNWSTSPMSSAAVPATQADPAIARAQSLLRELGYRPGPADGLMGPRTRDAVRDFQSKTGLSVTGSVDKQLLDTLEAYIR